MNILTDLSEPALAAAIEENSYALFDSFAALPGAEFVRSPELTRFSTPIVSPMFNGVMRSRLAAADADAAIDETIAAFRARGRPYAFWWTGPATSPADLGTRLVAHGFRPFDLDAPGMAVALAALEPAAATPSGFEIAPVQDERSLRTWAATFSEAYEVPAWAGESWVETTLALGIDRSPWQCYVGRFAGEPVATSMLIPGAGVAGLTAVATKAAARGHGIGTAMTLRPLLDARAMGYRAGVLWGTEMGEPLYRRLGFRRYCSISRYLWRADG